MKVLTCKRSNEFGMSPSAIGATERFWQEREVSKLVS